MLTRLACVLTGVALLVGALAAQQVGGATLNGRVTDPSGATIAGATVTATQTSTGLTRTTASTTAGLYGFTSLPAGDYDLSIEARGFKTAKLTSVSLAVGAVATIDLRLELGTATETVSVTEEVPVVETTRSQTSTVVNSKAVADLPIN